MKKLLIASLALCGLLATGASTASAYNYSNWSRLVWPYPASVYAGTSESINEFGPNGFSSTWFDFNGSGLKPAPSGNTWIRGRARCYASSSKTGSYVTRYSSWASPSSTPFPYTSGSCTSSYAYPSNFQSQVASDGYSTFYYAN